MRIGSGICEHPQQTTCGGRDMTEAAMQHNGQKIATELVFERERRRSRNVRRLKAALPILAVLMIGALAGKSLIGSMGGVSIDLASSTIEDGKLIMATPRLAGYSGHRPYEMKAARAIQEIANDDVLHLEEMSASLPIGTKDWANVAAARGKLIKSTNMLTIDSPALIQTTDGMTARLKSGVLDIDQGALTTDEPVEIDHSGSLVTADSMVVSEGGKVLVFERRVKVFIESQRINTASVGEKNAEQ